MKASDVFRASNPLFASKGTFAEAFPTVVTLVATVTPSDAYQPTTAQTYTEATACEYVDCESAVCFNGGFSLGGTLREMVRLGETDRRGTAICQGHEGSPKGRRLTRKCLQFFAYQISVTYRQPGAAVPHG